MWCPPQKRSYCPINKIGTQITTLELSKRLHILGVNHHLVAGICGNMFPEKTSLPAKQLETMENMKQTHIINIYTCRYIHIYILYIYKYSCMYIHMHTPTFPSNFFWLQSKQIRNTFYFFTSGSHPSKWVHNPPVGNEELPIFKKLPSCMILLSVWSRKRFMLDSQKKLKNIQIKFIQIPFRLGWITITILLSSDSFLPEASKKQGRMNFAKTPAFSKVKGLPANPVLLPSWRESPPGESHEENPPTFHEILVGS